MHRVRNIFSCLVLALAATAFLGSTPALADAAAGKAAYDMYCMSCHGAAGKGDGPMAAALPVKPRDFSTGTYSLDTDKDGKPGTDVDLANVIKNGAAAYGGSPMMAPWGATLSGDQVTDIVAHLKSLAK